MYFPSSKTISKYPFSQQKVSPPLYFSHKSNQKSNRLQFIEAIKLITKTMRVRRRFDLRYNFGLCEFYWKQLLYPRNLWNDLEAIILLVYISLVYVQPA